MVTAAVERIGSGTPATPVGFILNQNHQHLPGSFDLKVASREDGYATERHR
jgi:hypothetical protein